jgi:hypothetical protein
MQWQPLLQAARPGPRATQLLGTSLDDLHAYAHDQADTGPWPWPVCTDLHMDLIFTPTFRQLISHQYPSLLTPSHV